MEADNLGFRRKEKVLIFINSDFAEELKSILSQKYSTKILYDTLVEDLENKKIDILIVCDIKKFEAIIKKFGFFLDRFFKIMLSSLDKGLFELLDKYFLLDSKQKGLIDVVNEYGSLEKVIEDFPLNSLLVRTEYEDTDIFIKSVTYTEGKQIFHGSTRDYRGETVLFDKNCKQYVLLRGAIPVMEENYTLINIADFEETLITPKYDGTLINITFIHEGSSVHKFISNKSLKKFQVNNGTVFVGTKNILITNDPVILKRLERAVEVPMKSFLQRLVEKITSKTNVVFHFELIASDEYGFHTVSYDESFCVLLGLTYFDENNKTFRLPKDEYIKCIEVHKFNTKYQVEKFVNEQHSKMLNGDISVEPEGFVLYSSNSVFKYKFPEYFIAHKPIYNFEDAVLLSEKLKGNSRFAKLRFPLISKVTEISNLLKDYYSLSYDERCKKAKKHPIEIIKVNEEMTKLRFHRRQKFNTIAFIVENETISPEIFKAYAFQFLKH